MTRATKRAHEAVVDLVGDEHPLGRDAQLAGVGEARAHRPLRGAVEVGVAEHQDRVLPAELERAADQPVGALLRDRLAGGGRAGEADVVGAADDLRAELASGTGHHLPQVPGEAGLLEQLHAHQRGEHRLRVGLVHHGVAGEQRGQTVAQRQRERVVPRRDDPDDTLGDAVDLDPGETGHDTGDPLGVQVPVSGAAVVARGQRDVQRLVVRVLAGLAGLPADHVADLRLPLEEQVVQAEQRGLPLVDRGARPLLLGPARATERLRDVGRAGLRDHPDRLAVEGAVRRDALAAGGEHPVGEAAHERRLEGVGGGRVGAGSRGAVSSGSGVWLGVHIPRVCDRGLSCYPLVTPPAARRARRDADHRHVGTNRPLCRLQSG